MRFGRAARVLASSILVLAVAVAPAAALVRQTAGEPVRLFTIKDPRITESSGLATSTTLPGVVWTVNDSGDKPRVYGIDSHGRTVATLTLRGAPARDTEAVAVGPRVGGGSWLWVGDIGDNLSSWPTVRVYRAPEPSDVGNRDVPWTQYDFRFPDGPRDAETLLVTPATGRLYIVSKRVQGAAVYAAPRNLSTSHVNVLTKVTAAPPLATDGSFASDGRLVIRDYLRAYVSAGIGKPSTPLALPLQPQGESITWTAEGAAVLAGSEGEDSGVWRVPVVAAASPPLPTPSPGTSPGVGAGATPPAAVSQPDSGAEGRAWLPVAWVVGVGLLVGGALALGVRRKSSGSAESRTD